jgi:hypothetical protein
VFWKRYFVDVHWRLHTFVLSKCTCYVFIFPSAAYNVNLCNSPRSHMRNCNIFSCIQLLVHHSLENRNQLWGWKTVVLYSPTSKFLIFGQVVIFNWEVLLKPQKYPTHIILYMFQAMYQCRRGVASNRLTSLFPNLFVLEFEGALNVESFVPPPYSLIQHVGKCKSHQALPINELRRLQDRYPLS